jgi:hypothetical protein
MALLEDRPLPNQLLDWVAEQGYDMDKLLGVLDSDSYHKQHKINFVCEPTLFVQLFHISNTCFQHKRTRLARTGKFIGV